MLVIRHVWSLAVSRLADLFVICHVMSHCINPLKPYPVHYYLGRRGGGQTEGGLAWSVWCGVVWLLQWTVWHGCFVWVRGYWGIEWKTWNGELYLDFCVGVGVGDGKGSFVDGRVGC
jgi:hypothetical protein